MHVELASVQIWRHAKHSLGLLVFLLLQCGTLVERIAFRNALGKHVAGTLQDAISSSCIHTPHARHKRVRGSTRYLGVSTRISSPIRLHKVLPADDGTCNKGWVRTTWGRANDGLAAQSAFCSAVVISAVRCARNAKRDPSKMPVEAPSGCSRNRIGITGSQWIVAAVPLPISSSQNRWPQKRVKDATSLDLELKLMMNLAR